MSERRGMWGLNTRAEHPQRDASQRVRGLEFRGDYYLRADDLMEWLRKQEADFRERDWPGEARAMRAARETIEEDWLP